MTWPNRVTYSRMLLLPVFAIAALQVRAHPVFKYVAVGLFTAIAIGDAIDGYLAVKLNMSTCEGKFIDPLADKLLMITACVFLALPIWGLPGDAAPLKSEVAVVIVARDVFICVWVLLAFMSGIRTPVDPTRLGQVTTFFQMLMLGMVLLGTIWLWILTYVATPLSYLVAVLTISSGLHYLYKRGRKLPLSGESGAEDRENEV